MDFKRLRSQLSEYSSDYLSQLAYLANLRDRARAGIRTERSTVKGEVVDVVETHPGLELQVTRLMVQIAGEILDRAERELSESVTIEVEIVEAKPDEG